MTWFSKNITDPITDAAEWTFDKAGSAVEWGWDSATSAVEWGWEHSGEQVGAMIEQGFETTKDFVSGKTDELLGGGSGDIGGEMPSVQTAGGGWLPLIVAAAGAGLLIWGTGGKEMEKQKQQARAQLQ